MGLFSSKKTYVSSTIYNLAGAEADRPDYLKSLVTSNIIGDSKFSMSDTISRGYLNGPGIKFRNFYRWAVDNYGLIGVPSASLGSNVVINFSVLDDEIPHGVGETVKLQKAEVGIADYSWWAEQWMFDNEPTLVDTEWTADIDETTGDITITFEDTTEETFTPIGFDKTKLFLYTLYNILSMGTPGSIVTGSDTVITPSSDPFPAVPAGYILFSHDTDFEITETIETWVYEKIVYEGRDPIDDFLYSTRYLLYHIETRDLLDVVTDRRYRTDTQELIDQMWSTGAVWLYEIGSGNAVLDALISDDGDDDGYLPFIPLRLDNQFLSDSFNPDAYALAKKALRKTGSYTKYDDLIDNITESPDLSKFDYIYVMYGVPLNVIDNSSREYLFRFWDKCRLSQTTSETDLNDYITARDDYDLDRSAWVQWKLAQEDPFDPLFGTAEPSSAVQPAQPGSFVSIKATGTLDTNVNMKISWLTILTEDGVGEGKPGAEVGEIWLENIADPPGFDTVHILGDLKDLDREDVGTFSITWQLTDNSWTKLTVVGAVHENLIYKKKAVRVGSKEALEDVEDSGFLIPLHYATVREMTLVNSTQMQTACSYMVINTYTVVKSGFFGSLFFKIFVFIVIIAVTVLTVGTGTAPAVGILGSAAAVGTALGFSGIIAIIVGTIVNSIAAMILMRILQAGATALLGEKFGAILGAVLAVVGVAVGAGLMNGQSLAVVWGNLMSAPGLLNLTNALGNGITGYIQASTAEVMEKTQDLVAQFEKESKEIQEKYREEFGFGNGQFDPTLLTNSVFGRYEELNVFLTRTLLTGSDIADMSMDMLTNFATYTTSTKLPT